MKVLMKNAKKNKMESTKRLTLWIVMFFLIVSMVSLVPKAEAQGKLSGLVYADYSFVGAHHVEEFESKNAFWVRRVYFTYDHTLSESWKLRVRFEANSKGDYRSMETIDPYVKDLYVQYSMENNSLLFGLSGTPTFGQIEKVWGYRSVEKTPLDLYKMADSRDFGIAVKGDVANKKVYYHIMLANGEDKKSEFNKQKKVYGALGFSPVKEAYFEFYADFASGPEADTDIYTVQGFASYTHEKFRAGIQYSHQIHQDPIEKFDLDIASVFACFKLSEKAEVLARFDRMFDPNPVGANISYTPFDPTSPFNMFLAGIGIKLVENVEFIPNIQFVSYDDNGGNNDLYTKFTLYYRW